MEKNTSENYFKKENFFKKILLKIENFHVNEKDKGLKKFQPL